MSTIVINPLLWVTLFIGLSILIKKTRIKNFLRNLGFILFLVLTNNWLSTFFFHLWEYETLEVTHILEPYDIGILLGPFIYEGNHSPNSEEIILGETNRLTQAIVLYKQNKFKKFLLSGNDNSNLTRRHLISLCIPSDNILIEYKSTNTYENALLSKRFLNQKGIQSNKLLLITSALHMRRAKKCFDKVDLKVTPISVDYHTSCSEIWKFTLHDIIPDITALRKWRGLFRESASMLVFKFKNYI